MKIEGTLTPDLAKWLILALLIIAGLNAGDLAALA